MRRYIFLILATALILAVALGVYMNRQKGFIQIIEQSGLSAEAAYGGISWGDYNGDGYVDLLMPTISGYRLYRNNGDETFTDVTRTAGLIIGIDAASATFGDFKNNGCPDIYVANGIRDEGMADMLYRNNCDGTFTDVSEGAGIAQYSYHSRGLAWADYNNDGFLDIYVATFGVFDFIKTESSWTIAGWTYQPNILFRNNGDGTFTNVAAEAGVEGLASCEEYRSFQGLPREQMKNIAQGDRPPADLKNNWQPVWFDYNNNGLPDLYVTHESAINVLYRNNGDGTFTDTTEEAGLCQVHSTHGVAVGDFDNDGYLDLYVAGSRRNLFWHNNGDGTFTEISEDTGTANFGLLGWSAGFLDYDNDGYLDIYVINGATGNASFKDSYPDKSDSLFKNNGKGWFEDVSKKEGIFGNDSKTFGAFADFNNNGFVDIFILSDVGLNDIPVSNRLYKNIPNRNNWLTVKLVGTSSNRDGIGARIIVEMGDKTQIREVLSGASLLSQNSIWPTFGLGRSNMADTVTVRWPSGIVQTVRNIRSGQIITIIEE